MTLSLIFSSSLFYFLLLYYYISIVISNLSTLLLSLNSFLSIRSKSLLKKHLVSTLLCILWISLANIEFLNIFNELKYWRLKWVFKITETNRILILGFHKYQITSNHSSVLTRDGVPVPLGRGSSSGSEKF